MHRVSQTGCAVGRMNCSGLGSSKDGKTELLKEGSKQEKSGKKSCWTDRQLPATAEFFRHC